MLLYGQYNCSPDPPIDRALADWRLLERLVLVSECPLLLYYINGVHRSHPKEVCLSYKLFHFPPTLTRVSSP